MKSIEKLERKMRLRMRIIVLFLDAVPFLTTLRTCIVVLLPNEFHLA